MKRIELYYVSVSHGMIITSRSIRAKWRERQTSPTSQDSLVGGLARVIEDLEDYESTERLVTRELSRHYLAVIIGKWDPQMSKDMLR